METVIIKDGQRLEPAARALFNGELVAFPTETVYGLGGNAFLSSSAEKIYAAKGRPSDNPLIVHIADFEEVSTVAYAESENFKILTRAFWPGPLTVILPKKDIIPAAVTAGLSTVAVRFPENETARKLIRLAGCPTAAPSANISGSVSPTRAEYVYDDFNGKIPYIIDGGDCRTGLESTVITLADDVPTLLRPGSVTFEEIKRILPDAVMHPGLTGDLTEVKNPASPGMKYKHYSPKAEVILLDGAPEKVKKYIEQRLSDKICGACFDEYCLSGKNVFSIGSSEDLHTMAARIFNVLRAADKAGFERIYVPAVSENGIGLAIMNRLKKSSGGRIIKMV